MKLLFNGRNRITSGYRLPDRPSHNGLDIVGDDFQDILSPVAGIVKSSTIITDKSNSTWEWGNYVRVDDAEGRRHFFCHMASRAVKVGQQVRAGDKLGVMGNTGYSFGAHTHYEVRLSDGRTSINPADFLGIPNAKGTYTNEKSGWIFEDGSWYWYLGGVRQVSRWVQTDGLWYYVGADGKMATGWMTLSGKTYWLNTEKTDKLPLGACLITDESGALT